MGVVGVEMDFTYVTSFNVTFRAHRNGGGPAPRHIPDFPFPAANA